MECERMKAKETGL